LPVSSRLPNEGGTVIIEDDMSRSRLLATFGLLFLLLLAGLGLGAWWYLFGPNEFDSAELAPANSLVFASIPNGTAVLEGYETSQLKTIVSSPNFKTVHDAIAGVVGAKTIDLAHSLLPNLSGQSFIAITHYDPA
jgi:hypothetical protein